MRKLFFTVLWLACVHQPHLGQGASAGEPDFLRAVLQAYNTRKSFTENVYELLHIICPASVYCPGNDTPDTRNTSFENIVIEGSNFTEEFLQSYDEQAIVEARQFLRENIKYLKGCCVPCSCENNCVERQNCCPAMGTLTQNPDAIEQTKQLTQECVYASVRYYLPNQPFSPWDVLGLSYYMVTACFSDGISDAIIAKCTAPDPDNPEETRPVFSPSTERLYKNRYCAACNDDSEVTPLIPEFSFNRVFKLTGTPPFLPSTRQELYDMAIHKRKYANMLYTFPTNTQINSKDFECLYVDKSLVHHSIHECEASPKLDYNQVHLFQHACESTQSFYNSAQQYKNIFCMLCKHDGIYSGGRFGAVDGFCDTGKQRLSPESFTALLFDVQSVPTAPDDDADHAASQCTCTEVFDVKRNACRPIICPQGEIHNRCECYQFLKNITGLAIRINLEIRPKAADALEEERFPGMLDHNFPTKMKNAMNRVVSSRFGPLKSKVQGLFRLNSTAGIRNEVVYYYAETVTLQNSSDDRQEIERMFNVLHAGIELRILDTYMDISLGRKFVLSPSETGSVIIVSDSPESTSTVIEMLYPSVSKTLFTVLRHSQPVSKLVYCHRVRLAEDETASLHNATAALGWSQAYLDYVYWEQDGSMCLDDFKALFMADRSDAGALGKANRWIILLGAYVVYGMLLLNAGDY